MMKTLITSTEFTKFIFFNILEQKHLKICLFKNKAFYELVFRNYYFPYIVLYVLYYVIKSLIQIFYTDTYSKNNILYIK